MKLTLDRYAYLDSPIHSWKQTYKLVGLLALIFAFSFVKSLALLPVLVFISAFFYILSRLPISYLFSRLRYPGWFILAVVALLPFAVGDTTIWQWGILDIKQEGCLNALLIVVRFTCILVLSLVLFGTASFLESIKALRSLGLPQIIVDMTLLSYRYLEELGETLHTMQKALRLRGFNRHKLNRRYVTVISSLVGSLFVRSYERSYRIYHAMILRGYGNKNFGKNAGNQEQKRGGWLQYGSADFWATVTCLAIAFIIVVVEFFYLSK